MSDAESEQQHEFNQRRAMLLEVSRDMAFEQMAAGAPMIPFAAGVGPDGEIKFFRYAELDTEQPLDEVYTYTQNVLAGAAREGALIACTVVAAVEDADLEEGFETAISVHVEEPGFSRMILAPFRIDPGEGEDGKGELVQGEMVAYETEAVVFSD